MYFQGDAVIHEGIDYVNTVHNFIRHRLHDIFNLVLNHSKYLYYRIIIIIKKETR